MKLCVVHCILFIHVDIIYIMHLLLEVTYCFFASLLYSGDFRFQGPTAFGFGLDYHRNRCSGRFSFLSLGFGFGSVLTPPDPESA